MTLRPAKFSLKGLETGARGGCAATGTAGATKLGSAELDPVELELECWEGVLPRDGTGVGTLFETLRVRAGTLVARG